MDTLCVYHFLGLIRLRQIVVHFLMECKDIVIEFCKINFCNLRRGVCNELVLNKTKL